MRDMDIASLRELAKQLHDREHFVMMGPAYLVRMCDVASAGILALIDENERLRELLKEARDEIDHYADTAREHDLVARIDLARLAQHEDAG